MADEKSSLLYSGSQKFSFAKKLILLTGGNSGLGLEVCKVLCSKGHKVVTTVRTDEKGQHCLREVRQVYPQADIHYMLCELADLNSIKSFVKKFKSTWLIGGGTLDVLVNNAGVSPPNSTDRTMNPYNKDWELSMSVNCIAPVLLTDLLMNELKQCALSKGEARVVMVNSGIILQDLFLPYYADPEDPMSEKPGAYVHGGQAYKNSKAALMMCTLVLADELLGTGVQINSLCPGEIFSTNISRHLSDCERCFFQCMFGCCLRCCFGPQTIHQGGSSVVALTVGEQGEGHGLFYVKGDMKEPPPQCLDKHNQQKMMRVIRDLAQDQQI